MRPLVFQRHPFSALAILIFLSLVALPTLAAVRLSGVIPGSIAPSVLIVFSIWVYFLLAYDKKRALTNQWRVPESTLHFFEMLGGWPGSFIAQRRFRHKISKTSYQFTFWIIVIAYQVVAFDFLNDWKLSGFVMAFVFGHN